MIARHSSASSSVTPSLLPTLVFIPGAWHLPTCYDPIISLLEADYTCTRVTLPSTAGNPEATFKDDLDAARAAILVHTQKGHDVIVIAHSYGGIIGGSVIRGLAKSSSNDSSRDGHITGLILIASGFSVTGWSFMDPFFGHPPPSWRIGKTGFAELVADPRQLFYHDCSEADAARAVAALTPHSLLSLFEGGSHVYSGWLDVPSTYIGTTEDQGLPVFAQRMNIGLGRAMGAPLVRHRELRSSHSPFISQPQEVAECIQEAATEMTFTAAKASKAAGTITDAQLQSLDQLAASAAARVRSNPRIVQPAVSVWSPSSWFRWGVPLAIGYMVGWSIRGVKGARAWRVGK